jgi:GNAT superfamily N-acetyltransferase
MAARIERAECETVVAFAALMEERGTDVLIEPLGGASAIFAGPGQPFNKLAGLGFAGPVEEEDLARVERAFASRGAELRVELATLADPPVGALLTRRGFELAGYENVLGLAVTADVIERLQAARDADEARGVTVRRTTGGEARAWVEIVADGFGQPDRFDGPPPTESFERETIVDACAMSSRVPGMALYLAQRDGVVAGGGAIRLSEGLAQFCGAATLAAHRRHGVQSALLRARLLDAAREGCDLAVVTTEPASKSQENVQRAGFALLYARAVLIRRL